MKVLHKIPYLNYCIFISYLPSNNMEDPPFKLTTDEVTREDENLQKIDTYRTLFANPYKAAELGYIDEIILPKQTRFKLYQALDMTKSKSKSNPPKKTETYRFKVSRKAAKVAKYLNFAPSALLSNLSVNPPLASCLQIVLPFAECLIAPKK